MVAQTSIEKLAIQYAQDGECEKAVMLFGQQIDKKTASLLIYEPYISCLVKVKKFKEAKKVANYFFEKTKQPRFSIAEIFFLDQDGDTKKAKKLLDKIIEENYKNEVNSASIGVELAKQGYVNEAISLLEKNKKFLGQYFLHQIEIAQLYLRIDNQQKALEMLLDLAIVNENQYQIVISQLPAFMKNKSTYDNLKLALIKRIRASENNLVYEQLLTWALVQQKDWKNAFIHYKSLSKKKNDMGLELIVFANICNANKEYEIAAQSYAYVMELGKEERYYYQAQNGWLEARYDMIKMSTFSDTAKLNELERDYLTFIKQNKNNQYAIQAMKLLANIYLTKLHQPTKAINLLEEVINTPGNNRYFKAECKLDLGDAYLFTGDVWESELLYAQVEKDFKEEPLGQEAKFRKARLAFFRGEFEWAETQLEVLKGATSQLISNNAIELSLTIQDNLGLDSNYVAMESYATAQLLLYQNKYEAAINEVEKINLLFPKHSLVDEIVFLKAQVNARQGKWQAAIVFYNEIIAKYNNDILYDNALYELADIYENQLKDTANAMKYFEELILKQPGSLYTVDAARRYRILRGDVIREQENYYFEN